MSSDVQSTIHNFLHPQRTAALTAASAAAAAQGQFRAVNDATAIVSDAGGGSHAIRVRCKPANLFGAVDVNSPVIVKIHAGQNVTKPSSATTGTLAHAEASSVDCIATVLPDASGVVDISFTLAAADAAPRVTLQHRHYVASTTVVIA